MSRELALCLTGRSPPGDIRVNREFRARRRRTGTFVISMYLPSHFEETRIDVMHQLIRERPLATLVTLGADGLSANHIPFELDSAPAPLGALRCHVARANPVWRDFSAATEALVIFHGPQVYISPSWYETKKRSGEVVPTYNYAVVHAYGRLNVIDDRDWLRGLVTP